LAQKSTRTIPSRVVTSSKLASVSAVVAMIISDPVRCRRHLTVPAAPPMYTCAGRVAVARPSALAPLAPAEGGWTHDVRHARLRRGLRLLRALRGVRRAARATRRAPRGDGRPVAGR